MSEKERERGLERAIILKPRDFLTGVLRLHSSCRTKLLFEPSSTRLYRYAITDTQTPNQGRRMPISCVMAHAAHRFHVLTRGDVQLRTN